MTGLRLSGLTKRYGPGPAAVDGMTLEVAAGEFLALLGRLQTRALGTACPRLIETALAFGAKQHDQNTFGTQSVAPDSRTTGAHRCHCHGPPTRPGTTPCVTERRNRSHVIARSELQRR